MPRLTVTTPDGAKQRYQLSFEMSVVTIGRDPDCEIVINDPTVSKFHAELRRVPGGFCITDCHSTRGIIIDGAQTECAPLIDEQKIQLGDSTLSAMFTDDEINFCVAENEKALHEGTTIQPEDVLAPPAVVSPEPAIARAIPVQEPIVQQQPQPAAYAPQTPAQPAVQSPAPAPAVSPALRRSPAAGGPAVPGGQPSFNRYGSSPYTVQRSSGNGFFFFMLLLICIVAILAGMTLRHYVETGRLLHEDLLAKEKVEATDTAKPTEEPNVDQTVTKVTPVKKPDAGPSKPAEVAEKDPMDTAIKSQGKYTLPTVKEFIIP